MSPIAALPVPARETDASMFPRTYDEVFDIRGTTYDQAMRLYPDARNEEFIQALERADIRSGMRVADIPAGGGYLTRHLPAGVEWLGHEPCATFLNHHATAASQGQPLLPLPWSKASVDRTISIAGVHHLDDKRPLMTEVRRVTRPGGLFVLSDVATWSDVAGFLDGFVGDHNSTGHEGVFLDERTLQDLEETGWRIRSAEQVHYHWDFSSRAAMADFCRRLFDIRSATPNMIAAAIEDDLGVDRLADGSVGMRWSLMTIVAERPE